MRLGAVYDWRQLLTLVMLASDDLKDRPGEESTADTRRMACMQRRSLGLLSILFVGWKSVSCRMHQHVISCAV
jgi:hypothetical protein